MNRIPKIIKKQNLIPEFGYLLVLPDSVVAYNGQVGIRYDSAITSPQLLAQAQAHGAFAIIEPAKFLKVISSVQNLQKIEINKQSSTLEMAYGDSGRNKLSIQVALNVSEDLPHRKIPWKNFKDCGPNSIEVSSVFHDVSQIITKESSLMWGDIVGIYGGDNGLTSFDHGIYLCKNDVKTESFFCPLSVMDLGLTQVRYAVPDSDSVFLVGEHVQYVCTGISVSDQVKEMAVLEKEFNCGDKKSIQLNFLSNIWKRASVFNSEVITLNISGGEVLLEGSNWKELIGKTEAPNATFSVRMSLLKKWISGTLNHSISITADGRWFLYGDTRNGMKFYASLTSLPGSEPEQAADTTDNNSILTESEKEDVPVGSMLF